MKTACIAGIVLVASAASCSTLGPRTIRGDRFNYNEAAAESGKEQILLNLIRLRYGEPLYYVEVSSMLSQFRFEAAGTLSGWQNDIHGSYGPAIRAAFGLRGDPSRQTAAAGNLSFTDSPTITYRPLQGEEFVQRVMTSISPTVLILLAQCGWSADRLLQCCVQQINGIANRPLHDSDAAIAPDIRQFERLLFLFKRIQDGGMVRFAVELENGLPTPICYVPDPAPPVEGELVEARKLLGYPAQGLLRLRVTANMARVAPDELAVQTRSVLATMYALAGECIVPVSHSKEHQVGPERISAPPVRDDPWLRIEHSPLAQVDPFVQVYYNGYWFYINKSDWSSKRTFSLLTYLFSLQAANIAGQAAPVVTVGAGR